MPGCSKIARQNQLIVRANLTWNKKNLILPICYPTMKLWMGLTRGRWYAFLYFWYNQIFRRDIQHRIWFLNMLFLYRWESPISPWKKMILWNYFSNWNSQLERKLRDNFTGTYAHQIEEFHRYVFESSSKIYMDTCICSKKKWEGSLDFF